MYSPAWTLMPMFCRSISSLLMPRHLQSPSMPSWSLWSSIIQRLSDTTTQQWHNTHLMSYTSTLMQLKEKENLCILFTTHIHPRRYKHLFQQVHQKKSESSLGFLLPLWLSPLFFCNGSSTIRQTQRKITNTAKLPSTELPTMLPQKSLL